MMKKAFALLLALLLCFGLTACGGSGREVVSGFDGTPALNRTLIGNHIERVELTTDNWSDYIKEYSYDVELIEKDAFGEVTQKETVTVYRLGYGTERYHCLSATIELKHKQTGDILLLGQTLPSNIVEDICAVRLEPFHLEEYECTRIKGYLYFVDYPADVLEEVLDPFDRYSVYYGNATITISSKSIEGSWDVDLEAKVIESNSDDWKRYFE